MRRGVVLGVFVLATLLLASSTQAAVVTVDVTIKAVNPQARGITVVYDGGLGEKTIELDVSRKAEITVNGKDGTLDSLGPGLKAKVSYDKDLAIVTKIEATGMTVAAKNPELVEVSELNDEGRNFYPWPSEDGLTIYWARRNESQKWTIWTARRNNPELPFTGNKLVFKGYAPTVSSDALEMILINDRTDGEEGMSLYVAKRDAPDKPFNRPTEIPELAKSYPHSPCLAPDGLTLYFVSRPTTSDYKGSAIVYSTRKDNSSPWSNPKPLPGLVSNDGSILLSPFVAANGLSVVLEAARPTPTGEKGNFMRWARSSIDQPFSKYTYIEFDKLPPMVGGNPRYVAATNELFFARNFYQNGKYVPSRSNLWVVRNFKLESLLSGAGDPTTEAENKEITGKGNVTSTAVGHGPVDLLAMVVPQQHRILGVWQKQRGELIGAGDSEQKPIATCTVPFKTSSSYSLRVEFTRLNGPKNGFANPTVVFPVGKATAQFWLDIGHIQAHCGFSTIENADPRYNKTGIQSVRIVDNTRYTLDIRTTILAKGQARVEVMLDGRPHFRWTGQQEELSVSPHWMFPTEGSFGLGIGGKAIFHTAKVLVRAERRSH